jgi:hypothetical protein
VYNYSGNNPIHDIDPSGFIPGNDWGAKEIPSGCPQGWNFRSPEEGLSSNSYEWYIDPLHKKFYKNILETWARMYCDGGSGDNTEIKSASSPLNPSTENSHRPDDDGAITDAEALNWYRTWKTRNDAGSDCALYVWLSSLDLSQVRQCMFPDVGIPTLFDFSKDPRLILTNSDTKLVYGSIYLTLQSDGTVISYSDTYDYDTDWKKWGNWGLDFLHNVANTIGGWRAGNGNDYPIYFFGSVPIKP